MKNTKSFALIALLVGSSALAGFTDTSHGATDSAGAAETVSANNCGDDTAAAWGKTDFSVAEVTVGTKGYNTAELFAQRPSEGSRQELVAAVAALNLSMVSDSAISDDALNAANAIDMWLMQTELSKRPTAAPSNAVQVLRSYVATIPSCGSSL